MRRLSAGDIDYKAIKADDHDEIGRWPARSRCSGQAKSNDAVCRTRGRRAGRKKSTRRGHRANDQRVPGERYGGDCRGDRKCGSHGDNGVQPCRASQVAPIRRRGAASASSEATSSNGRTVAGATDELGKSFARSANRRCRRKASSSAPLQWRYPPASRSVTVRQHEAHRQRRKAHSRYRRADQPARPQRHDRGRTRRRGWSRLHCRRVGGQDACHRNRHGDRRYLCADWRNSGIDDRSGRRHPLNQRCHGGCQSVCRRHRRGGRGASAATQEISRNVREATRGAQELAGGMTNVTDAIRETNFSATAVLGASKALTAQASELEGAVDAFLKSVAAA